MSKQKQAFGRWGEEKAAQFLEAKGYEILARNVRTAHGELDLVATKENKLIFVEVKSRRSKQFGFPEEAVTGEKQRHILEAAETYISAHPDMLGDWQVDVISIQAIKGKPLEIEHFENAFG